MRIWELDGVRIVIRGEGNDEAGDYDFANAAPRNWTFQKFIDTRLREGIGDRDVMAINGSGDIVRGNTQLATIKESYA